MAEAAKGHRAGCGPPRPTSMRSATTASCPTATPARWWPPTAPSSGCACRGSTRRACSRRCWTAARAPSASGPLTEGARRPPLRPGLDVLETSWMTKTGWMIVHDALVLAAASEEDVRACAPRDLGPRRRAHAGADGRNALPRQIEVSVPASPRSTTRPGGDLEARSTRGASPRTPAAAASPAAARRHTPRAGRPRRPRGRGPSRAGERAFLCLSWREELSGPGDVDEAVDCIEETVNLWRRWLERGTFADHPWRWTLQRSALVLKGLTYEPTGAHDRGADHLAARDAWRRAELGLPLHLDPATRASRSGALHVIGFDQEAREFMEFVSRLCHGRGPRDRRSCSGSGARPSSPSSRSTTWTATSPRSRCGWATPPTTSAKTTSTGRSSTRSTSTPRPGRAMPEDMAPFVLEQAEAAIGGLAPARPGHLGGCGEPKHYVSSKMMAGWRSTAPPACARFISEDELAERWRSRGQGDPHRHPGERGERSGVFRQHYGTDALDASLLLIPLVRFLARGRRAGARDGARDRRRAHRARPGPSLPADETEDGLDRQGRHVHDLLVLARLGALGDRRAGAGAKALRAGALPRDASRALRGGDRGAERSSARQLPAAFTHLALINAVSHVIADEQLGEREKPGCSPRCAPRAQPGNRRAEALAARLGPRGRGRPRPAGRTLRQRCARSTRGVRRP